ncbi:MAG: AmmeMemoRadiSam system protein B [Candidatus Omnitrophica bacterium]|nr:AmmeMemoRadiSam system protein B [Candidatus Omnitrophota bacterium]
MEDNNFIRPPYVAGQFYPGQKEPLIKLLDKLIEHDISKEKIMGIVSPHAGYIYSGPVAGAGFSKVIIPEKIVLIGPNHSGLGKSFSLMPEGKWITPLGEVSVDKEITSHILETSRYLERDYLAHKYEHSLEVQIPFIQYLKKDFSIIPIIISEAPLSLYQDLGKELAQILKPWQKNILIVASSDMTHYESRKVAEQKDKLAIDAIISLDEDLLYEQVNKYNISMCGYAPCIVMLATLKNWGAKSASLIKYQTSGDVSGEYTSVVGYASIIVK